MKHLMCVCVFTQKCPKPDKCCVLNLRWDLGSTNLELWQDRNNLNLSVWAAWNMWAVRKTAKLPNSFLHTHTHTHTRTHTVCSCAAMRSSLFVMCPNSMPETFLFYIIRNSHKLSGNTQSMRVVNYLSIWSKIKSVVVTDGKVLI